MSGTVLEHPTAKRPRRRKTRPRIDADNGAAHEPQKRLKNEENTATTSSTHETEALTQNVSPIESSFFFRDIETSPTLTRLISLLLSYFMFDSLPGETSQSSSLVTEKSTLSSLIQLPPQSHRVSEIQSSLEHYISDSNLIRDTALLEKLGIEYFWNKKTRERFSHSHTSNSTSEKDATSGQDVLVNKATCLLQQFPSTQCPKVDVHSLVSWLKSSFSTEEWEQLLRVLSLGEHSQCLTDIHKTLIFEHCILCGEGVANKYEQNALPVFHEGYLWLAAQHFLSCPKLKALHVTLEDLIAAASNSSTLRVAFLPKKTSAYQQFLDSLCNFITGKEWDRSCLGRKGAGSLSESLAFRSTDPHSPGPASSHCPKNTEALETESSFNQKYSTKRIIVAFRELANLLRQQNFPVSHEQRRSTEAKADGTWCIGRVWDPELQLKAVEDAVHARTIFIDNIPFKCTPDAVRAMIQEECGLTAAHVRIPRFVVSRENKGFAFVEMEKAEDVPLCISVLHERWPKTWSSPTDPKHSAATSLVRRNKRPLTACTHSEWQQSRLDHKTRDILGCSKEQKQHIHNTLDSLSYWVMLKNISGSPSLLALTHFIYHTVVPVRVCYAPNTTTAFIQLADEEDRKRLCFDVALRRYSFGKTQALEIHPIQSPWTLNEEVAEQHCLTATPILE